MYQYICTNFVYIIKSKMAKYHKLKKKRFLQKLSTVKVDMFTSLRLFDLNYDYSWQRYCYKCTNFFFFVFVSNDHLRIKQIKTFPSPRFSFNVLQGSTSFYLALPIKMVVSDHQGVFWSRRVSRLSVRVLQGSTSFYLALPLKMVVSDHQWVLW